MAQSPARGLTTLRETSDVEVISSGAMLRPCFTYTAEVDLEGPGAELAALGIVQGGTANS